MKNTHLIILFGIFIFFLTVTEINSKFNGFEKEIESINPTKCYICNKEIKHHQEFRVVYLSRTINGADTTYRYGRLGHKECVQSLLMPLMIK